MDKEIKKSEVSLESTIEIIAIELVHLSDLLFLIPESFYDMDYRSELNELKSALANAHESAAHLCWEHEELKENRKNFSKATLATKIYLLQEKYNALRKENINLENQFYALLEKICHYVLQISKRNDEFLSSEFQTFIDITHQLQTAPTILERYPGNINKDYSILRDDFDKYDRLLNKIIASVKHVKTFKDKQASLRNEYALPATETNQEKINLILHHYQKKLVELYQALADEMKFLLYDIFQPNHPLNARCKEILLTCGQASLLQRFSLIKQHEHHHQKRVRDVTPEELEVIKKKWKINPAK